MIYVDKKFLLPFVTLIALTTSTNFGLADNDCRALLDRDPWDEIQFSDVFFTNCVEKLGVGVRKQSPYADHGNTLLHYAASGSSGLRYVEYLLKKGARVNAVNRLGETPLHYASYKPDQSAIISPNTSIIIEKLLTAGANIDARAVDKRGRTPLFLAVETNNNYAVRSLVANGANIYAKDDANFSVLNRAIYMVPRQNDADLGARREGALEIILILLDAGLNPRKSSENSRISTDEMIEIGSRNFNESEAYFRLIEALQQ